ncbi:unnamed protein product [Prorocentrum cordatum]|uniref:Ribosome biogenesis regulatory protein n=1 Tax=Prorocentrum cordatum TaxID=2364126 RepID=A0ABN9RDG3_9DINO|nr:unnamed protein product [Polarella glacialis]
MAPKPSQPQQVRPAVEFQEISRRVSRASNVLDKAKQLWIRTREEHEKDYWTHGGRPPMSWLKQRRRRWQQPRKPSRPRTTVDVGAAPQEDFQMQLSPGKLLEGVELQEPDKKMVAERSAAGNILLQQALDQAMRSPKTGFEKHPPEVADFADRLATKRKTGDAGASVAAPGTPPTPAPAPGAASDSDAGAGPRVPPSGRAPAEAGAAGQAAVVEARRKQLREEAGRDITRVRRGAKSMW